MAPRFEPSASTPGDFAFIIDLTEWNEHPGDPPRLYVRCSGCRTLFQCDHEERICPGCRDLLKDLDFGALTLNP